VELINATVKKVIFKRRFMPILTREHFMKPLKEIIASLVVVLSIFPMSAFNHEMLVHRYRHGNWQAVAAQKTPVSSQ